MPATALKSGLSKAYQQQLVGLIDRVAQGGICLACIVSAFLRLQGLDQWDHLCHMLALWTWEGRWAATGAKEDLVEGKGRVEVVMVGSLGVGEVLAAEAIMT